MVTIISNLVESTLSKYSKTVDDNQTCRTCFYGSIISSGQNIHCEHFDYFTAIARTMGCGHLDSSLLGGLVDVDVIVRPEHTCHLWSKYGAVGEILGG